MVYVRNLSNSSAIHGIAPGECAWTDLDLVEGLERLVPDRRVPPPAPVPSEPEPVRRGPGRPRKDRGDYQSSSPLARTGEPEPASEQILAPVPARE